jgi:cystathionine beta-lyase/cystathionine gamma-synthase
MAFVDALGSIPQATSLGGTHTTASHAASSSHRQLDDAALEAAGLLPSAVRVSVGLEPAELLLDDLTQALDRVRDVMRQR